MKVSGFTIIRNAIKYDFPVVECISSILPICDEFVVAIGKSEDNTLDLIRSIDSKKIRIIETAWDDQLVGTGKVLASETNKALQEVSSDTDWAFYIQSDEVVHENDLPVIEEEMVKWKNDPGVDGLLFKYRHFYGSFDYVASSPHWYQKEIRIIKIGRSIYSFNDAQGFRKGENRKLWVRPADAHIYHYGWVRDPSTMQKKIISSLTWQVPVVDESILQADKFDYSGIDRLEIYNMSHPDVMNDRIKRKNWNFTRDISFNRISFKDRIKGFSKKHLGIELGYKNYRLIK